MLVAERRRRIVQILQEDGRATVAELAEALAVSPSTVRRDLALLAQHEVVQRTPGGALLPSELPHERRRFEPSFLEKQQERREEKRAVARAATAMVEPGMAVFLDAGTTVLELARLLKEIPQLTTVTNSVAAVLELQSAGADRERTLILTGGSVKQHTLALVGPLAEQTITRIHVDLAFLGMNGIDAEAGCTTPTLEEAATKRAMIRSARRTIVLVDHDKLGQVSLVQVAGPAEIARIVTDEAADSECVRRLQAAGFEVALAPLLGEKP